MVLGWSLKSLLVKYFNSIDCIWPIPKTLQRRHCRFVRRVWECQNGRRVSADDGFSPTSCHLILADHRLEQIMENWIRVLLYIYIYFLMFYLQYQTVYFLGEIPHLTKVTGICRILPSCVWVSVRRISGAPLPFPGDKHRSSGRRTSSSHGIV